MRTVFFGLFSIIAFSAFPQQRYISSGIIAYSGGAYERAVKDMNYALKDVNMVSKEEAAKAYYYRGISTFRLIKKNPKSEVLSAWPFLSVYADFTQATVLDEEKWKERIQPDAGALYTNLFEEGVRLFEVAEQSTYGSENARRYYAITIDHLKAARTIRDNYEVNFHLGKGYHKIAENYARAKIERFVANYNAAITSYENALKYNPESLDCVNALIEVAAILKDQERLHKYKLMAVNLSGNSR